MDLRNSYTVHVGTWALHYEMEGGWERTKSALIYLQISFVAAFCPFSKTRQSGGVTMSRVKS